MTAVVLPGLRRHDPDPRADAVLEAAGLLLDGAPTERGLLFLGLPRRSPCSRVLRRRRGRPREPSPRSERLALARLRSKPEPRPTTVRALQPHFQAGRLALELLFEFGLGQGDGGRGRPARRGPRDPDRDARAPAGLVRPSTPSTTGSPLAEHGSTSTRRSTGPSWPGRTAVELASLRGNTGNRGPAPRAGSGPPTFSRRSWSSRGDGR